MVKKKDYALSKHVMHTRGDDLMIKKKLRIRALSSGRGEEEEDGEDEEEEEEEEEEGGEMQVHLQGKHPKSVRMRLGLTSAATSPPEGDSSKFANMTHHEQSRNGRIAERWMT
jgi:hypothetical protein